MITHVIYHIPGRKVGCTKSLEARKKKYFQKEGAVPEIVILEELHDKTDQEAGDIEVMWRSRFGYRSEPHYTVIIDRNRIGSQKSLEVVSYKDRSEWGKLGGQRGGPIGGKRRAELLSPERLTEIGIIGGNRIFELGVGVHALSPEERILNGQKGGYKTYELKLGWFAIPEDVRLENARKAAKKGGIRSAELFTGERRAAAARKGGLIAGRRTAELGTGGFQQIVECPYCGQRGRLAPMRRWHFDNCKNRG